MFGATNFSAPLLAVAGAGLVWLIGADGVFVSATIWEGRGAGWAGFGGAAGGSGAEARSCALSVAAGEGGMSFEVVPDCGTLQPARASESAMSNPNRPERRQA